jgi:hypothetical protein
MPFRDDLAAARQHVERLEAEKADLIARLRGERKPPSRVRFSIGVVLATLLALVGVSTIGLLASERPGPTLLPQPASVEPPAPTIVVLSAPLGVEDLRPGTGAAARAGNTLVTHYVGRLGTPLGEEFDSSRKHDPPFRFRLGQGHVIKGWEQGLVGMRVGGLRRLTVPPDLAYGERGVPPTVPPRATLVFDVELLAIDP